MEMHWCSSAFGDMVISTSNAMKSHADRENDAFAE
jgi:hypothetical protein